MPDPTLGELQIKFEAHEQRDVDRYDSTIKAMTEGFSSVVDKLDAIDEQLRKTVDDHETRIRTLESNVAGVLTAKQQSDRDTRIYGTILVFAVGIAEFIASHYWK